MVNELRTLLHESSEHAPYAAFDATALLRAGRSRTRRRRAVVVGTAAALVATIVGGSALALDRNGPDRAMPAPPLPQDGRTLHLADASTADLEPVFTHVNEDLQQFNGQYVDGITTDGLAVFRDGPHDADHEARMSLVDLESGDESQLPDLTYPVNSLLEATEDRIVYSGGSASATTMFGTGAVILDRATATWREISWPDLPPTTPVGMSVGPDGRLYVAAYDVPAGVSADGDPNALIGLPTDLWSVSLTDPDDVRDEGLRIDTFAIDDGHLVWTDDTDPRVLVRDLTTGEETSFDPGLAAGCNHFGSDLEDGKIVLSLFCKGGGERDDRLQIVTLTGKPVVTIQDASISGNTNNGGQVLVYGHGRDQTGHYAYDLDTGTFVRLSTNDSMWGMGGPVTEGYVMWTEGYQGRSGSTQKIARIP